MLNFKNTTILFLVTGSILVIALFSSSNLLPLLYILIGIYILILAIGSYKIQLNFYTNSINHAKNINKVALTFDDGPHPIFTSKILKILETNNAKATFFVIGKNVEQYPDITKEILKYNCEIGNHSYSHSVLIDFKTNTKLMHDIKMANDAIFKHTTQVPKLFRPPFGVTTPIINSVIKKMNLKSIGWTIRSFDTIIKEKEFLIKKIVSGIKGGDIILLHDTQEITVNILPDLISAIKKSNLQLVSVSELINENPYENQ